MSGHRYDVRQAVTVCDTKVDKQLPRRAGQNMSPGKTFLANTFPQHFYRTVWAYLVSPLTSKKTGMTFLSKTRDHFSGSGINIQGLIRSIRLYCDVDP